MTYSDDAPLFMLYGEQQNWPKLDRLHCETIASRSKLHNWHIRLHRHVSLYQILYLFKGTATVHLEQNNYQIKGPAIVEVPQAFIHGFEFSELCQGHVLTIAYPLITNLINHLGPNSNIPEKPLLTLSKSIDDPDGLNLAFNELTKTYLSNNNFRTAQSEAWFTIIYTNIRQLNHSIAANPKKSRSFNRFNQFIDLLELNYQTHHMVHWYAKHMNITTSHLNLIVRENSNKSPLEHIHNRINLEANRSLIYTTMTISEISNFLGFNEPAHFSRFFRTINGISPKEFRNKIITN